jgi:hypothetical protein
LRRWVSYRYPKLFGSRSVSDSPPGPRVFGDCVRGLRLPIHLTVCFEAGRFTLTQSSWTASARHCSRKWMSGYAAKALVLPRDRGQFGTLTICSLGEPILPSQGNLRFPLTFTYRGCPRNLPSQKPWATTRIGVFSVRPRKGPETPPQPFFGPLSPRTVLDE